MPEGGFEHQAFSCDSNQGRSVVERTEKDDTDVMGIAPQQGKSSGKEEVCLL